MAVNAMALNASISGATTSVDGIPFTAMDKTKRPTAKAVQQLKKDLTAYLLAIPSQRGGGQLGHLALMYTPAEYQALPGNPQAFVVPVHPGPFALAPNTQTATTKVRQLAWQQEVDDHRTYKNTQIQGVALIRAIVPAPFLEAMNDPNTGFALVTIQALFAHVMNTYGALTKDDLDANEKDLVAPWSMDTPIEDLFKRTDDCITFSNLQGGNPITENKAL